VTGNPVIPVFGNPIEIVVQSKDTDYTCCGGIETCQPGGGPPPHKHVNEEEIFTVLEGEFDVLQRDRWVRMKPGGVYCSLRDTWHGFRNVSSGQGRMLFIVNSGGLDEYFGEISALAMPDGIEELKTISARYGYYFQGLE
jgi:quercetin dioxygenase-like cupin family protein